VVSVEKHPNADKLKLPTVDYGQGRTKKMVTGAPNLNVGDAGQKVILALAGSVLYDGHATPKKLSELKPGKIRGEPSDAMVCSSFELGIDDEHEGIILLEEDAPVGAALVDFMGDVVLELEVTPNLARALSLIGTAREVAALTGQTLKLPPHTTPSQPSPDAGGGQEGRVNVIIEDPKLSSRYAAALLQGVKIGPSPGWMQRRLTYAGMRPINNVVDITNYVMLEWGQPLHAFDHDKLAARAGGKAPTITVRPARAGEAMKTLDGVNRTLTPDVLVIADEAGPIALAGVMGGAETEVSKTTTNVLLESANFDFLNIRRTIKTLNLPSEASMRFSRGIHPELVMPAAQRAAELMRQHAGAVVCKGIVDVYPAPASPQVIELKMSEVRRLLGMDFPIEEATRILTALEFQVERHGSDVLRVTAPPHRLDIQEGPADLIEDLARLYGYDRLPATLLADRLPPQTGNPALEFEERVRDLLTGAGLQETINYALTTPEREALLGVQQAEYVRLLNPISSERSVMRQSVLTSVLDAAAANLRHTADVRLFEIGHVYVSRANAKLPDEPRRLAVVLCGRRAPDFWGETDKAPAPLDFFDFKGVVEALVGGLHLPAPSYRRSSTPCLHPGKAAELLADGRVIGYFGELHPKIAESFDMAGRQVLASEFDLEALQATTPARHGYTAIPRFPAALRDVAVIVPEATPADQVEAEIRAGGGDLLRGVRLFDLYHGDSIAAGAKSLAYALTYQADDRTLTDKEVDRAHKKIQERLRHVLQARIRGEDQ
ncbi:MAG TPA: phenylalanine--tRNA ligase subunit beta, partial [Planctomycetales bacterium]|nr:phenylalanine--tRNA ligase subunit beta [Planctomycetales bacterium]